MLTTLALLGSMLLGDPGPLSGNTYAMKVGGAALTAVACDSPITSDAVSVGGFRFLRLGISITRVAATDVQMTCKHGDSSTAVNYKIPVEKYAGHTSYSKQKTWRWPEEGANLAADDTWSWTIDLWEYLYVQCTFTCTAAGATDELTVTARVGVGQ